MIIILIVMYVLYHRLYYGLYKDLSGYNMIDNYIYIWTIYGKIWMIEKVDIYTQGL
jgi:hypothetical protein